MTLTAKPIIKDQYWVITDGNNKVGNVIANQDGYEVKVNGDNLHFTSTKDISQKIKIKFERGDISYNSHAPIYPEYPCPDKVYNSVMDIKRKLHLFTTEPNSKCLQAAGWFVLDLNGKPQVIFCPKYIYIQRYSYYGPYKTENEANEKLNSYV